MPVVTFRGQSHSVLPGETLLEALVRARVRVRYSCRQGHCHTCMLRLSSGEVTLSEKQKLPRRFTSSGHFLACQATLQSDVSVEEPELFGLENRGQLLGRCAFGKHSLLRLTPDVELSWSAGQWIQLGHPSGATLRCFISNSSPSEELHILVPAEPDFVVSEWLATGVAVGDYLAFEGPEGSLRYDRSLRNAPLFLLGDSAAMPPLLGVARQALSEQHQAEIVVVQFVTSESEDTDIEASARSLGLVPSDTNFRLSRVSVSQDLVAGAGLFPPFGGAQAELCDHGVYLLGEADWVSALRSFSVLHGVDRGWLFSDVNALASLSSVGGGGPPDGSPLQSLHRAVLAEIAALMRQAFPRDAAGQAALRAALQAYYVRLKTDALLDNRFGELLLANASKRELEFAVQVQNEADPQLEHPLRHVGASLSAALFDFQEQLLVSSFRHAGLAEPLLRAWSAAREMQRDRLVSAA